MLRKIAFTVLCIFLITQCLPLAALADVVLEDYKTEEELRQAIIGDEKWVEKFPHGLFNFIGTEFQINEKQKFLEFAVVRQGGTQGKTTVNFKAIDVSAEYGQDYVIRVYDNFKKNEIVKNEAAIMLIDTLGDDASINISESSKKRTVVGEAYGESQQDYQGDETDKQRSSQKALAETDVTVAEAVYENSYKDLSKFDLTVGAGNNRVGSLRKARETYLGTTSDRPSWKAIDAGEVENLKVQYDAFLDHMSGTEATLEFEDGEYIKYLYFIPLNDELSESEEQVMFALERPKGGSSRGEYYMAYVNIVDDEKPETPLFEIEASQISVDEGTASVVVRRSGGLHQYSSVVIGTEEGSAISGVDYEPGIEELFFTPGMTTQTVTVNVLENTRREKERQFTIALDRTNESVQAASSEAKVTLPDFSGAKVLVAEEPHNINAEKITPYGFSPGKGKWIVSGEDFQKAGNIAFKNGIQPMMTGNGISYNYTVNGNTPEAQSQGVNYDFHSLGGVNSVDFYYYNNGKGKAGRYSYQGNVPLRYTKNNQLFLEPRNVYGYAGKCAAPIQIKTQSLDDKKWVLTSQISLDTYAELGNHTAPSFSDITLNLREYSTSIQSAQKMQRKKYSINKGVIKSEGVYKEYDPGSLYVKRVDSNVGNYQASPLNPKVYRSDRIEFGYQYSGDNPNGRYGQYKGVEIKNGTNWIYFPGTELILDSNFFRKNGIFDAIKGGTITIRPVFEKINTYAQINFNDTANGYLKNAPGINATKKTYLYYDEDLYIGDIITDLEAQTNYASKLPIWNSYKGRSDQSSPECIIVTDTVAKAKINYVLENNRNWLELTFRDPSIIVKADPSVYKSSIDMLPYKLDGVEYSSKEAFSLAVQAAYDARKKPTLDMEFKYIFASDFPDPKGTVKEEFGTPERACLSVYKSDGTLRKTYFINYNEEIDSFKLSISPVDEGWELDDIASVYIEGSNVSSGRRAQTRELVIDFLTTFRSGVVVLDTEEGNLIPKYGDVKTPIVIDPANPLKHYKMRAFTPPGFSAVWSDFSPDTNNDGENSQAEEVELEKKLRILLNDPKISLIDKNIWTNEFYFGNAFSYTPKYFNPAKIYYTIEKLVTGTVQKTIEFKLLERYSTVLNPDIYSWDLPIKEAQVFIGEKQIEDKGEGFYQDRGYYQSGRNYMGQLLFGGQEFIFPIKPGDMKVIINTSDLVKPTELKAYITEGSKRTEQDLKKNNGLLSIKNASTKFTYRMNGSGAGVSPNDSIVRIYDFSGRLYSEARTGPPNNGEFSYELNTYTEGVKAGYTMTIAGLMTKGDGGILQEYPEVRTGVTFKDPLTAINALAKFNTSVKPDLQMVGKINNQYDLGMDVVVDEKAENTDYVDTKGFQRSAKTITFGYSDEYKKEYINNVKNPDKGVDESLEEEVEKGGVDGEVAEAAEDGKKKGSGGGDFNMQYTISLALTIEDGQVQSADGLPKYDGKQYFRSLVIMATATPNYKRERTYMTPIGVPVTLTLLAHGRATAVLAFDAYEEDYTKQYTAEYCLSGSGTASLKPENYDIYTKFIIKPTITLGAGAGFDYLSLNVEGNARFDFEFTMPITAHAISSKSNGGMTIDASVGIKMLFYKKNWTLYKSKYISFFGDGGAPERSLLATLENPYNSYLYESADGISDDEILSRDYLSDKGEWNAPDNLGEVLAGNEIVLQSGVFPYPQTKLIKIDERKTLFLFIDDEEKRDSRNRASLMYSIIEDGKASQPVALDNNGTWDEAPDAFMVDGQILVVWSDAGKKFTAEDREYDILEAMNISGIWFDPNTEIFGQKFSITKTVEGGDVYSDLKPKISYDPNTKRLMVYYTKIDHGDGWQVPLYSSDPEAEPVLEMPNPLYGDIINGYSVLAYRYAEYDESSKEFIWNETYTSEEGLDSAEFYGQRFLSLAPLAEIIEEEHEIEDETIKIGEEYVTLKHIGTTQRVEDYQGLSDPRIMDVDLTTHDGLAVFAYIMDYESDLKTSDDQQLYVQTYNYEDNTFSDPIQITNNDVQDTKPQFVYTNGVIYLYWLQDGKIVYTNISELFQEGRLKEVFAPGSSGKKFKIIDKANAGKDAHVNMAVEFGDGIDEYKIVSGEDRVYALWTEDGISYENGLVLGEEGTDDPENINKERQIYAASAHLRNDEGTVSFSWCQPVQLTLEEGQSFSDLSFLVTGEDEFLALYVRFIQQYDEDRGYFTDGNSRRTLAMNTFLVTSELELEEITLSKEYPIAGETVDAELKVLNTGLKAFENYAYQYYLDCDGVNYYESQWYSRGESSELDHILGGSSVSLKASIDLPESLKDVEKMEIGFLVKDASDTILGSKEKEISVKPEISIQVLEKELKSKNSAYFSLYVRNAGNKIFDDEFTLESQDKILHKEQIKLVPGEDKIIFFETELEGVKFGELLVAEDESRYDLLTLLFKFGEYENTTDLKRQISVDNFNNMQMIQDFRILENGQQIQNDAQFIMDKNSVVSLKTDLVKKDGLGIDPEEEEDASMLKVSWDSSNSDVVSVLSNGTLISMAEGTAIITATLHPDIRTTMAYEDGSFKMLDTSYILPEGALKQESFEVKVGNVIEENTKPKKSDAASGEMVQPITKIIDSKGNVMGNIIATLNSITETASVEVRKDLLDKAFEGSKNIEIDIPEIKGAKTYELVLPSGALSLEDNQKAIILKTALGTITMPSNMITGKDGKGAKKIALSMSDGDKSKLSAEIRAEIGDRPIIELSLKLDGKQISWNNPDAPVAISIPYMPTVEELKNPEHIVVRYIDGNSQIVSVPGGRYDAETGTVTFTTSHFSKYAVSYIYKTFADLDAVKWAKKPIEVMASKGIINGTEKNRFSPTANITRADYLMLLIRILGLTADFDSNFNDVKKGAYYYEGVGIANKMGITIGSGNNNFNPTGNISRQDMMVLTARALEKFKGLEVAENTAILDKFTDKDKIAGYAAQSLAALVQEKLIEGSENKINPGGQTTRAEAAVFLYRIYSELVQ